MRYAAEYRDPSRPAKGVRRFLYIAAFDEGQVREHATDNLPPGGWQLHDVRAAQRNESFVEVPAE
jgi:hypothetical protein